MNTNWRPRVSEPAPKAHVDKFGTLLGQLLWARGLDNLDQGQSFTDPKLEHLSSPFTLENMELCADRVCKAILNRERIAVYSDYDMDGMSGLALLASFFKLLNYDDFVTFQPDRFNDGYGVHASAIEALADKNVQVVITVDTGITAVEACLAAKTRGIDVIITDHHKQVGDLPATPYIVNPNQNSDTSGLTYLSGVGVAFYLAIAVRAKLRDRDFFAGNTQPDLRILLDLFTLGTIADSVELKGDNRALIRHGLVYLLHTKRPGLRALLDLTLPETLCISARDVAFSVTPKLNAASRMGKAHLSTELLLTQDSERGIELARELLELNEQRAQIQKQVYAEAEMQAMEQIDADNPAILVVAGEWHEGVLGVVAAKLVEQFSRPAVLLTQLHETGLLRGSMRTQLPISCVRALETCKHLLIKFGGHTMAAGLQMLASNLDEFRNTLNKNVKVFLETQSHDASILYDAELELDACAIIEIEGLVSAAPWGQGNPEPMFRVNSLPVAKLEVLKEKHLRCQLSSGATIIGFFKSQELTKLAELGCQNFDALVTPEINRFRNKKTVQLRLHHVRPSQTTHSSS